MKKILVTRKLLQSNEDRLKKLYDVKLNSNDVLMNISIISNNKIANNIVLTDLSNRYEIRLLVK